MVKIPAKYRTAWYWIVAAVAAGASVAELVGVVPADAVEQGLALGVRFGAILTALLALFNIKPDNDSEEYMLPYVEDAYRNDR